MRTIAAPLLVVTALVAYGCNQEVEVVEKVDAEPPRTDNAILWIQHSVEFRATALQTYTEAARDLDGFLADENWSALPGISGNGDLPPAIILDVDETAVSNFDFQLNHLPYTAEKHFRWSRDHHAIEVPGAVNFVNAAQAAGVEVFFVTNRPCEEVEGVEGWCPQKESTLGDLLEAGYTTDADHVMLAWERDGWGKEKLTRRQHIAETHRVIMLFGDDISDFIECTRSSPVDPCTVPATRDSRHAALSAYDDMWGHGWYILANPMHGSWTQVE